jgi:hypothetical protein
MTISIKQEDVTDDLVVTTITCTEHGELCYTISPHYGAKVAMVHRTKYPLCAPIKSDQFR